MRLNLFIAKCGVASRRKADSLIKEGKVKVSGKIVKEPFFDVGDKHKVEVQGAPITFKKKIYLIFNKPKGVVTTLHSRFPCRKVIDFFPSEFKGVFPVGRLDKDSTGLLLLTNDGDFCYKLTHPKFCVEKEYLVRLDRGLSLCALRQAKKGIANEGDYLKVKTISAGEPEYGEFCYNVVVCEGKKRHLRRLFQQLGAEVKSLKRVRIGGLRLGRLAQGRYELMNPAQAYQALG